MAERTVTVSSTGKTFSYTGWKVGWAAGPAELIAGVQRAHQFLTFCASTPLHVAMAAALDRLDDEFVATLQRDYRARRDQLVDMLTDCGFSVAVPEGAYFALADFSALSDSDDRTFARQLIEQAGVAAIPPSAFYAVDKHDGRSLLRFAFCKQAPTLNEAGRRLRDWARRR
jgi:N-succinyldiaminopimelate aminotransferase